MTQDWPTAAPAADQGAPARPAGQSRLSTIRADFFLDPAERLSEQERALMVAMLHGLVGDIADELRGALPNGAAAANVSSNALLVDRLAKSRLLDQAGLMTLLIRRADQERIAGARARRGGHEERLIQGFVSHSDGGVSAAAMALILARGARRDRFGRSLPAFDDLPAATAEQLVHATAAGLRAGVAAKLGPAADAALGAASADLVARHDHSRSLEALTAALIDELHRSGAIDDALVLSAAQEGDVALLAEIAALSGGLSGSDALDEILSGNGRRIIALFKVAGFSRELSAGLLASVGELLGIDDPGEAIGLYDRITDEQVMAARIWLTSAAAYRSALEALGTGHGQRSF